MKRLAALTTLALLCMSSPAYAGDAAFCPPSLITTYIRVDDPVSIQAVDMGDKTPHADLSQPLDLRGKYTAHSAVLVQQPDGTKLPAVMLCGRPALNRSGHFAFYSFLTLIVGMLVIYLLSLFRKKDEPIE